MWNRLLIILLLILGNQALYWAATLQEEASLQEADASGEEIDVDGETLNTLYTFDNFRIQVSLKNDRLSLLYTLPDK